MNSGESGQIQKRAKEFEGYLIGFLKRMGFKDLNGRSRDCYTISLHSQPDISEVS